MDGIEYMVKVWETVDGWGWEARSVDSDGKILRQNAGAAGSEASAKRAAETFVRHDLNRREDKHSYDNADWWTVTELSHGEMHYSTRK